MEYIIGTTYYIYIAYVIIIIIINIDYSTYYYKWGVLYMGVPQIINFDGFLHHKPSISGYPHLWTPPYRFETC